MVDSAIFLANRLLDEGSKSLNFFLDLNPSDWDTVIYVDGTPWTSKQVLAHFLATEIRIYELIENILNGGEGIPETFELDEFNQGEVNRLVNESTENMLHHFSETREKTAALIRTLSQTQLQLQGRHPFLGIAPLNDIVKLIYRHNLIHQREIRAALQNNPKQGDNI